MSDMFFKVVLSQDCLRYLPIYEEIRPNDGIFVLAGYSIREWYVLIAFLPPPKKRSWVAS